MSDDGWNRDQLRTTVAQKYGHTLGLDNPEDLNLIGKGIHGIMHPHAMLVDYL